MKNVFIIIAIIAFFIASENIYSQTNTWDGSASTSWTVAANWSLGHVPLSTENVVIPSVPANQPLLAGTNGVCNTLTVNSGATLTLSATTLNNALLTASGSATINGALTIGGTATTTAKLIVVNITWASGSSMTGGQNGSIEVSGNWEFSAGSAVSMGSCGATFNGSANTEIISKSSNSSFSFIVINKTSGHTVSISSTSTATLKINISLTILTGSTLLGQADITTILGNNLYNSGHFSFSSGTVSLEKSSGTQVIQVNSGDLFNNLTINCGGTVTINNYLQLLNNLTIQSGIFDPLGNTIVLFGNWSNAVGPDAFIEGTGTVVFNGGNFHQYCSNETFYHLNVNKSLGGAFRMNGTSVTCAQYDWSAGAVDVGNNGTFTALDLADDGLFGGYYVNPGGTINLYQDNYQTVDLCGSLTYTAGGTMNVYGGSGYSQWPNNANASITMNGGTLDFKDNGISINPSATYSLTTNISGGTIRTSGGFYSSRSDFNPAGGTIELYGSANTNLDVTAGSVRNLKIIKDAANTVTLITNITINGVLTTESGTLKATNKVLSTADHININSGGTLWIENGSQLKLTGGKILTVSEGGTLKAIGILGSNAKITRNGATSFHEFQVNGTISARYAIFEYNYGVNIWSTATIDPANSFDQCTFQNGGDRFLYIGNTQEITIRDANFPTAPIANNIWKNNDAGRITFKDATGAYAGATYENDPYNRIDWSASQPGLWTGAVSSDWNTTGNWDDLTVPIGTTNVTIPAGVVNMPVLSSGTVTCNNLTLTGTLTIRNAIMQVNGNLGVNGLLTMNNAGAQLIVQGDVSWNSGSTASITASCVIHAYGHWNFNVGANAQLGNGAVYFKGGSDKFIRSYSANCSFWNLVSNKTGMFAIELYDMSTQPLTVNASLTTVINSKFISSGSQNIIVKGNIVGNGVFQCNGGYVILKGASQSITPNSNDYFNNLEFNQSGTVTIVNTYTNILNIKGGMKLTSGVFDAGSNIIKVGGGWNNTAGPDAFTEATSRVIFNGLGIQSVLQNENFNTIEINKTSGLLMINGPEVTCASYDWTAGSISAANGGIFTANELADDGLFGGYEVQSGGVINLLQDISQSVNVNGSLHVEYGSAINVYGGNGASQWASGANADIYMDGGTLDFKDQGINISTSVPHTLTTDISGGTIRTSSGFFCNRSDFNPTGGTLELYGSADAELTVSAGSVMGLVIDKGVSNTIQLAGNMTINGDTYIKGGTLSAVNRVITNGGVIRIINHGIFILGANSQLRMANSTALIASDGGTVQTMGTPTQGVLITHTTGGYSFYNHFGGHLSAKYTTFEYCSSVMVEGEIIDPENAFYHCTFTNGSAGSLLVIENTQDITIRGANFPTLPPTYNVYKGSTDGHIVFRDATGPYAGPAYERDQWNKIDWITSTPGLWTGEVSSNWYTAENWDDYNVPTSSTDVMIPAGTPNSPVIGAGTAYCNHLTVPAGAVLTQSPGSAFYVSGNFDASEGQFTMNGASYLYFTGSTDTYWSEYFYNDTYTNVRVQKDLSSIGVHFNGTATCSGTVEIREGILFVMHSLSITNTGTTAFEVEDGGGLSFTSMSPGRISCAGNVHFLDGSKSDLAGDEIFCARDFIVDPLARVSGALHLEMNGSGTQYIENLAGDSLSLSTLIINKPGGTCYLKSGDLVLHNGPEIRSGTLSCNNGPSPTATYNIYAGYDWRNWVGPSGFEESTGRVVFTGMLTGGEARCFGETFNILEVAVPGQLMILGNVTCAAYDWTSGGVNVVEGGYSFTANDLLDDAISGDYYLYTGGTINLHHVDGKVNLNGHLHIYGGNFNVYGGTTTSYWPVAPSGGIEMSGGTLDFKDVGIIVWDGTAAPLTENITGGTIRTPGIFITDRPGFTPSGGTLELYGPTDANLQTHNGSYVHNVVINKSATDQPLSGMISYRYDTEIKGDLTIQNGIFSAWAGATLNISGNWNNLAGPSAYEEGTGKVVFKGTDNAGILTPETFYNLDLAKTNPLHDDLTLMQDVTVTNDLSISDGTLKMNAPANLAVSGNLSISLNSGLNATGEYGPQVFVGKDWINTNTVYDDEIGFNPGNSSQVIFNGTTDQCLTTSCPQEDFANLKIDKSSGQFRPNSNIFCNSNMVIQNGSWEDNVSATLHHTFLGNFTVQPTGAFFNAFALNTVEFAGNLNANLRYSSNTGCFHHLLINKTTGSSVTQFGNANCLFGGNLTIENGTYNVNGNTLWVDGDVAINDFGNFSLPSASLLVLANNKNLNVNSGGKLEIAGTSGSNAMIRADVSTARYGLNVNSGGTIAAEYGIFKNTGSNGIYVRPGSTVDPAHAFNGCTFQDGAAGGSLLVLNNNQFLTIRNAVFPANTWNGSSNVSKILNIGHAFFVDFSGAFSGEDFDNDVNNLVDWVPTLMAEVSAAPETVCAGSEVQLNVVAAGGYPGYSYAWSPAESLSNPLIYNPVATPDFTTNYAVTVTDMLGTTTTGNVTVTVHPNLPASISIAASANPSPPGSSVTFTATPTNGGNAPSYQWKVNGSDVGQDLATYSYNPLYGDQVACVLTSNAPCVSVNPAPSNTITMIMVPAYITASGDVLEGTDTCFNAYGTITVPVQPGTFTIHEGGSAIFIAGSRIKFLPGASVLPGGYMHAWITLTNEYCGSQPPAMVAVVAGTEIPVVRVPASHLFTVYPNPTTGSFTLSHKGNDLSGEIKVVVSGTLGNKILSSSFSGEIRQQFDLSDQPPGLYFIILKTTDHFETLKLILNR